MIEQFVRENVEAQTVRLDFFLKLLDRMFQEAVGLHESTVPLTLLFASVLKARQAGHAVQLIAQQGYVEEVLSISRTLVEVTVNAAYLQFAGDGELVRYLQFHPESVYQQVGMLRQKRGRMFNSGIMGKLSDLMQRGGQRAGGEGNEPGGSIVDGALADGSGGVVGSCEPYPGDVAAGEALLSQGALGGAWDDWIAGQLCHAADESRGGEAGASAEPAVGGVVCGEPEPDDVVYFFEQRVSAGHGWFDRRGCECGLGVACEPRGTVAVRLLVRTFAL